MPERPSVSQHSGSCISLGKQTFDLYFASDVAREHFIILKLIDARKALLPTAIPNVVK